MVVGSKRRGEGLMFGRSHGITGAFVHNYIDWTEGRQGREISPGAEIGVQPGHGVSIVLVPLVFLAEPDGFDGEIDILWRSERFRHGKEESKYHNPPSHPPPGPKRITQLRSQLRDARSQMQDPRSLGPFTPVQVRQDRIAESVAGIQPFTNVLAGSELIVPE